MKPPTVFMYSGQGSQYYQMAHELYRENARFRLWMDHCEEIASPILGKSLLATIYDPRVSKSEPFDSLGDSNAALLCVEYSLTRLVEEMGHRADFLLGYSLGEISAAVVADVFSLATGLTFAVEFARLVESRTPRSGMLAVVGPLELLRTRARLFEDCWVTGRNFGSNFVVSGPVRRIDELERALERESILCERLPVNYGVHTELIDPVKAQCERLLGCVSFSAPQIPLISSVSMSRVELVSPANIWAALRTPVEFSRTIEGLLARGDAIFIDLGPSATLATCIKYILPPNSRSRGVSTLNRFGNDVKAMNEFQSRMAAL